MLLFKSSHSSNLNLNLLRNKKFNWNKCINMSPLYLAHLPHTALSALKILSYFLL